jgi:hypothetical protein
LHIMAGVYFKYQVGDVTGTSMKLTGYLRAGGSVEVLGLISLSVEFYLGFSYTHTDGQGSKVKGDAIVTVEVDILFFHQSVSMTLHREFADPQITFADLIEETDWFNYCGAFA